MGEAKRRKKRQKDLIGIWCCGFVPLYLLFTGFAGFSGLSAYKTWTFYGLAAVLAVLGGICFYRDRKRGLPVSLDPAEIAALLFWFFSLLSALFSPLEQGSPWLDPASHEGFVTITCYVALFLIVSRWGAPGEGLFCALFWSMVIFCMICLLQALGKNPLGLYPLNPYTNEPQSFYDGYGVLYSGAYAGTIGNVDFVSAFLAMVVPMLLLHARGQKPAQAWPGWVLALCCVGVLIWVQVLCGPVGLAAGGAICLAVLCPDGWRKWVLAALAVLALAALAVLWLFDLPVNFFHELHELLHGRAEDSFGTGRFFIWRQMLARIPDRLWLGVGPDMVRYSGLSPFVRYDEATGLVAAVGNLTDAHCYPLQILYCQGLPALLSWLSLVGISLRRWGKHRTDRATAILGGGAVCFLCAMLFCPSSVIVMPFFWLTLGLLNANAKNGAEA